MQAIVLVSHGWSAGWAGFMGNEWLRTHQLDRFAVESVVFDQHFVVHPSPAAWHVPLFTSRFQLGPELAEQDHLIRLLGEYGVRTLRVRNVQKSDVDQGPDVWNSTFDVVDRDEATPGEALFARIDETLEQLRNASDWLLWIETDRFVPPWNVSMDFFDEYSQDMAFLKENEEPSPWDEPPLGSRDVDDHDLERLQATFGAVVTEWDAEFAEWAELFREHQADRNALIVVTSGYGISLGEHGWLGPGGRRPYEELTHVPLLLRFPKAEQGGRRVPSLTADIDLLPTLFEWFRKPPPEDRHGGSLLPIAHSATAPARTCIAHGLVNPRGIELALRLPDWLSMLSPVEPPLLFRKPEDRWEVNNLRQHHLEWAEHLEAIVTAYFSQADAAAGPLPIPRDYDAIMNPFPESQHEHGSPGERDLGPAESESDLRGHQGNEEN